MARTPVRDLSVDTDYQPTQMNQGLRYGFRPGEPGDNCARADTHVVCSRFMSGILSKQERLLVATGGIIEILRVLSGRVGLWGFGIVYG